jgi:hypothetical protein
VGEWGGAKKISKEREKKRKEKKKKKGTKKKKKVSVWIERTNKNSDNYESAC